MKVGNSVLGFVQLLVLLAVPLDAFALTPGRFNGGALQNRAVLRGRARATLPSLAAEALPSALGAPEATNTVRTVTGGGNGEQVGMWNGLVGIFWLQDERYLFSLAFWFTHFVAP